MNELSRSAVHLETFRGDTQISIGTGCLYRQSDRVWLVTAGHLVTMHHPDTGIALNEGGVFPDRLVALCLGSMEADDGATYYQWQPCDIALYTEDLQPAWLTHPDGVSIDLVAIEVTNSPRFPGEHLLVNDDNDTYHAFEVEAGDDAFVLGFPEGLTGGGNFPIWKRATIASEPSSPAKHLLVDTATRGGMSGAPVFARRTGWHAGSTGSIFDDDAPIGQVNAFLGIYVGRPLADDTGFLAQLGSVFKAACLQELILTASQPS